MKNIQRYRITSNISKWSSHFATSWCAKLTQGISAGKIQLFAMKIHYYLRLIRLYFQWRTNSRKQHIYIRIYRTPIRANRLPGFRTHAHCRYNYDRAQYTVSKMGIVFQSDVAVLCRTYTDITINGSALINATQGAFRCKERDTREIEMKYIRIVIKIVINVW